MPNIDFMKVFDAAAASLNASEHINVDAVDLNRYTASIMIDDTSSIDFTAEISEFSVDLSVDKTSFTQKEYEKFLSMFEYCLEQKFFKNIEFKTGETARDYKIKISF